MLHLSYDVTSRIHGAMSLYTKHICCPLDSDKYNMRTVTILEIDNAQKNKLRLPNLLGIELQRLRIMITQATGWNAH